MVVLPVAATSAPKLTLGANFNRKKLWNHGNNGDNRYPGTSGGTVPTTPQIPRSSSQSGGFASPYLLASGLLSPKSGGGCWSRRNCIVFQLMKMDLKKFNFKFRIFGDITYKV